MAAVDAPADAGVADPGVDASSRSSSSMPKRRAMIGCCSSSNTALAVKRDVATASTASSACAQGLRALAGRPVIVYGMARAFGALPNTASISGAASFEVGRDDQDVRRPRRVRAGEQREQLVLQHFELARERVADVHFDAAVVGGERRRCRAPDRSCRGSRSARRRAAWRRRSATKSASSTTAALPSVSSRSMCACVCLAPRGEQPVADFVMRGATGRGEVGQAARIDDFEPVLAARVEHVEREVDPAREPVQDVEVERRHGRQAEDVRGAPAVPRAPARRAPSPSSPRRRRPTDGGCRCRDRGRCAATARPASARPRAARRRGARSARACRRATPRASRGGR